MSNEAIARFVARKLFEIGDEPVDRVQRIEFKGGAYPDHETALGGLNEEALAATIARILNQHSAETGGASR